MTFHSALDIALSAMYDKARALDPNNKSFNPDPELDELAEAIRLVAAHMDEMALDK